MTIKIENYKFLTFGEPTPQSGRIYTVDEFDYGDSFRLITSPEEAREAASNNFEQFGVNACHSDGVVENIRIDGNFLVGDVRLTGPNSEAYAKLLSTNRAEITIAGMGEIIKESKFVTKFKLKNFILTENTTHPHK